MRTTGWGQAVFAATLVGLGVFGLLSGDFAAIWRPVPKHWPSREALAYVLALVTLGAGLGLLWRRTAARAAGILTAVLLIWLVAMKGRVVLASPATPVVYETAAETGAVLAAAWALLGSLTTAGSAGGPFGFAGGGRGLVIARILYGACLVAFGIAHFAYLKFTAAFIPGWIPAHVAFAELTGATYIAAGLAILSGVLARLAAALAALQIGLFTLIIWVPVMLKLPPHIDQWTEPVTSWVLTAAAWVMADTWRDRPWLALRRAA